MWDLLQTVQGRSLIFVSPFLFLCNVLMVSSLTCAGKVFRGRISFHSFRNFVAQQKTDIWSF